MAADDRDKIANAIDRTGHIIAAAQAVIPVTPADTDLPQGVCRALLVGTAGAANIQDATGTTRAAVPLQAGYNPIQCKQVRLGTVAANIWALY